MMNFKVCIVISHIIFFIFNNVHKYHKSDLTTTTTILIKVSSHNANIIAKDTQPDIIKDRWPNFQDFIEEIVNDLIGDTRAAREPAKVDCSATEHTIVKLFEKKESVLWVFSDQGSRWKKRCEISQGANRQTQT